MQIIFTFLQNRYIILMGDVMSSKLIENINNYISYLNSQSLSVSVHGRSTSGILEHNLHTNPFCTFVKTNDAAWKNCVKCQKKIHGINKEHFFGMCYAGVEEYVFKVDDTTFISVSGYGIDRQKAYSRIERLSREFFINKDELVNVYENGLKHTPDDIEKLKTLIYPLCHMLQLMKFTVGEASDIQTKSKTFDALLAYVQRNVMHDITLRNIADACGCSESTAAHLFKKYTNRTIKEYILDSRIEYAKKLLRTSDISITNIALLCGFSNSNYFSSVFKKLTGNSPTHYRDDGEN